jgi:hypothetical protein
LYIRSQINFRFCLLSLILEALCRQFIWREIAKLRLRSSILYLRDQERRLAASLAQQY